MPIVVTAVIVLGALVIVDLSLSAAIIRKLRTLESQSAGSPPAGLPPGARPGEFTALSTGGTPVTSDQLRGRETLVGFFSSDCAGCLPKAPLFAQAAGRARGQGIEAVAVITVMERQPDDLLAALGDGVSVVVEQGRGPMGRAFSIGAFPWFFLIDPNGAVVVGGGDPDACLEASARA